jgi:hypothetical protein
VPPIETAIGVGLLFRPTRTLAAALAVGMHLMIMAAIGPWGHNWNTVVWPWNVAMPLLVVILFYRTPSVSPRSIVVPRGDLYHAGVLVLFGVMPALSFVGLWDMYLSSALYSGNTLQGSAEISPEVRAGLPPTVRKVCEPAIGGRWRLHFRDWSAEELNVPVYPARRVLRNIAQTLCDRAAQESGEVVLVVLERPDWRTGIRSETRLPCTPQGKLP